MGDEISFTLCEFSNDGKQMTRETVTAQKGETLSKVMKRRRPDDEEPMLFRQEDIDIDIDVLDMIIEKYGGQFLSVIPPENENGVYERTLYNISKERLN